MSWDVLGIGENSIDHVYRLPAYPLPNTATSKLPITSHRVLPGGQVATTLATCAALGLRAGYAGVFGSDSNGTRIRDALTAAGVDLSSAVIRDVPNRYAVILVDEGEGERVVLWDRDARLDLQPDEIGPELVARTRLLHVDDVDVEGAITAARAARQAGITVTSDIDRVLARTVELLRAVTIPMFAEHVPSQLTGESDPGRALRQLRREHDGLLCVTLGARGSMLLDGDRLHHAAAYRIDVVDSTGAGDVFRGAFIYALLRGDRPDAILRFANAAAAVSCTRIGALDSVPSLRDVETLIRDGHTG
jgi:sulfofructose kinase